jgi:hypothetical protein
MVWISSGAAGAALLIAALGSAAGQSRPAPAGKPPSRELWLFFSPEATRLASDLEKVGEVLARHPEIVFRPALLSADTSFVRKPREDLAQAVKALGALQRGGVSLRLWDDEGLARAKKLRITRFPAWALIDAPDPTGTRRARVALGYGPNFEELLR